MIGIAILTNEKIVKLAHKAYLNSVFVNPIFQNKGVANMLLSTVIEYARGRYEQILLNVASDNVVAINLYRKFNFEIYGSEIMALKNEDEYVDEVLIKCFL